jgi:replicative DNA helicase
MSTVQENIQVTVQDVPYSIELEQQILASILVDDKKMKLAFEILNTIEMFYDKSNRTIYTAMLYLYRNNLLIDYMPLAERIQAMKVKNEDELIDYLLSLSNSFSANTSFESKVDSLVEYYHKRKMYKTALDIVTKPLNGVASQELVAQVKGSVDSMGISSNIEVDKFEDYIDDWLEYQQDTTPIQSHKLGYKLLDDLVLLEDSNLMLIGARPSVGKSAFATNLVKNFCLQGKHPLFVSLEMNKKEFMNRLVSNMAHIPARKLKRKEEKTNAEWGAILNVKEQIRKFKFNFYDKGGMNVEQLIGLCKYLKKKDELDVLVIDYLQLLDSNQFKGQKQYQISYISQKLKQIAMELDIPVIALSQLNRGVVEHGKIRKPQLSDLRDSGKRLPVIPFPLIRGVYATA